MTGLTEKIQERLTKAKTNAKEQVHEAKEKVNPLSQTNRQERHEKQAHEQEVRKAQSEAREKEEIRRAAERGKRQAQPQRSSRSHISAAPFTGVARSGGKAPAYGFANYYDLVPQAPKKKPAPQRVTKISKSGVITITEPPVTSEQPKKKQPPNSWDMISVPEMHTGHSSNPFNLEIHKPHVPKTKQKKGTKKSGWRIGDLL